MRSRVVARSVSKQHGGISSNCIEGVLENKQIFFNVDDQATSKLWWKIKEKNVDHKDITITLKTECLTFFFTHKLFDQLNRVRPSILTESYEQA